MVFATPISNNTLGYFWMSRLRRKQFERRRKGYIATTFIWVRARWERFFHMRIQLNWGIFL
jgi:hypothetical protein